MKTIGNVVWFVLCGIWLGIAYVLAGLLSCITIIGIPFGIQSFKMAKLALWPFGADIVWTYFGFADDDAARNDLRLVQTNLVGSAGLVSMEDAAVCNMIRRAIGGAGDHVAEPAAGGADHFIVLRAGAGALMR